MSGLILTPKVIGEISRIDDAARESRSIIEQAERDGNETVKAFAVAGAVQAIRSMITPEMMAAIMSLQGSSLGFRGDKEYGEAIVRDVFIEATLRNFRMIGNEVNIIAGRFYGARDGWKRKVEELPGVSNVVITMGRVEKNPNTVETMLVTCRADWLHYGKPDCIVFSEAGDFDTRLSVKQNKLKGDEPPRLLDDVMIGKAERKLFKKMYEKIAGITVTYDQDEEPQQRLLGPDDAPKYTKEDAYRDFLAEIDRVITGHHLHFVMRAIESDRLIDDDQREKLLSQADLRMQRDFPEKSASESAGDPSAKLHLEFVGRVDACDFSDKKAVKILGDDIGNAVKASKLSESQAGDLRDRFASGINDAKKE